MRPLFAAVLVAAILGLVQSYMVFQKAVARPLQPEAAPAATSEWLLTITPNFAAEADAFQLSSASLEVRRIGEASPLMHHEDPIEPGESVGATVQLPSGESTLALDAWLLESGTEPDAEFQATIELVQEGQSPIRKTVRFERDFERLEATIEVVLP